MTVCAVLFLLQSFLSAEPTRNRGDKKSAFEVNGTKIGESKEESQRSEKSAVMSTYAYARKDIDSYTITLMRSCITNSIFTRRGTGARGKMFDIVNEAVYKTVYFNDQNKVIAVQITFENVNDRRIIEIKKLLEEKYRRDVQTQHNVYTYDTGQKIMIRMEVTPTRYKQSDKKDPDLYRVVNFYYQADMLSDSINEFNKKNDIKLDDIL